jgi:hypothetical protein
MQWLSGEIAGPFRCSADGGHLYSYYLPGYETSAPQEVS